MSGHVIICTFVCFGTKNTMLKIVKAFLDTIKIYKYRRVIIRPSSELIQNYLIPSALWDPVALTIVGAIVLWVHICYYSVYIKFLGTPCIRYGTPGVRTHFHSSFMKEKMVNSPIFTKNSFKMNCTEIMKNITFIPHICN